MKNLKSQMDEILKMKNNKEMKEANLNYVADKTSSLENREQGFEQELFNVFNDLNVRVERIEQQAGISLVPMKKNNPTLANIKRYLVNVKSYINSLNDGRSSDEFAAINQCVNKLGGITINPFERDFELFSKYSKIQTLLIANGILLNSWISLIQTHCFSSGMAATTKNEVMMNFWKRFSLLFHLLNRKLLRSNCYNHLKEIIYLLGPFICNGLMQLKLILSLKLQLFGSRINFYKNAKVIDS
ncbi:hypothetical protein C6P42_003514 [Pichia californica]|nr:hypothetical protein C6P42_003514 [[Candida] californica]